LAVEGLGEAEAAGEAGVEVFASPLGGEESFSALLGECDFSDVVFSEVAGSFILLE